MALCTQIPFIVMMRLMSVNLDIYANRLFKRRPTKMVFRPIQPYQYKDEYPEYLMLQKRHTLINT